ncbi:MAG: T9SS type A sorting domain-containing protein [Chitinophagaceae bacterium]|nr:T9SS type A sorting domain-containing protein [Chitinophagaceae bacterium]
MSYIFKNIFLTSAALVLHIVSFSQFTPGNSYFGQNNYIEYIAGNLPIIISATHGGNLNPGNIPDRVCNNPITITDLYTNELAMEIDTAFVNLMGCHPHVILTHLDRKKIDNNRNIADGACGNPAAETAWTEFHNFIDTAKKYVTKQYGKGFYMDLHGHGHDIQRLELGYLVNSDKYGLIDFLLNDFLNSNPNNSSLRNLASNNLLNLPHTELLRGDLALGTLLANKGYPSVPSKQIPSILEGEDYFSGGYNIENYTSAAGGTIDGVQIECYKDGVRDTKANRKKFAESLAQSVKTYLTEHYGLQPAMQNCVEILPVELSYFKAFWNSNGKQVDIKWQTLSETNNNYFEILKSTDGINFLSINKIAAKGNSEIITDYTAYDNNVVAGKMYYKLRQHDKDGKYKDFETKMVTITGNQSAIKVDPIGINNQIKIHLPAGEKLPVQTEVFSASGKNVGKYTLSIPGTNIISAHNLSPGLYIVKIYSKGSVASYKVLMQ